jgi:aerobic-type carbon monoxide dehydrogenase small subunit (CoxS/CutS family)
MHAGAYMETKALLDVNPKPTVAEIKAALGGHICRCGSFYSFIESVNLAGGK